ncbi:pyridoxal phosphate-dependent aminotransferase [Burkholderiaceae bacterium FT117]|uniref:pyridoxal phosphate-dependent aminotransferase n=1 Tax=Zeimonas sediminis TaxID=2944268 RepID=UPI002342E289|nr:pyridoxal phosphate-dependent aminotransferase [Zeimonas sediminis]MCM5569614.1 pyridoxal phosphate-dependent aminotransferase [Zeimonas sediminis]
MSTASFPHRSLAPAATHGEPPRPRPAIESLEGSRIREVANAGLGLPDVIPFWFGEPDAVTPAFIREAAKAALDAGDTFYHHNLGIGPLRDALSHYLGRAHLPVDRERVVVTSSGVNALMLAAQTILSPGDRVVAVVPLWPNVTEIPRILGAEVTRVPLALTADHRWVLDLDRLIDAIGTDARAVIVNSPNNPTGWTMPRDAMRALLEHCRRHGIWIVSDEAYERLVFDGSFQAPSMLDLAAPDDRLIVANTFSKAWQMTGWRLGWLVVPPSLTGDLAKLIEFNTSCAPGFVQQAAVAALRDGEPFVREFVSELGRRRDALLSGLARIDRVTAGIPDGAMYAFLRVDGELDSLTLAKALVREARIGLAPGAAFGPEGEGFLRWCFARPIPALEEAVGRLDAYLRRS